MVPNDEPERSVSAVGSITTYTYSGPVTWPRKRRSAEASVEGDHSANNRLELLPAVTQIVTYIVDGKTGRIRRKEE